MDALDISDGNLKVLYLGLQHTVCGNLPVGYHFAFTLLPSASSVGL